MSNYSGQLNYSTEDTLEAARPSLRSSVEQFQSPAALTPSVFISITNDLLAANYEMLEIVGEVASFKVNQGKWVFFDIKDDEASVSCFMTLYQMKMPIEDGMKVIVRGTPKLTKWGKFSFTVNAVKPVGEGSIKKSFEILKKKLTDEGLFDPAKKRPLPKYLTKLGVISSLQAAGYADFIKILNARWGGIHVQVAHTQVQGLDAPAQIVKALKYFNERGEVQTIAILRGGGSADDLSCFNDEELTRAIAASKIPIITGIGHEIDESLADLAADVKASTPSNAAEMLTPDRNDMKLGVGMMIDRIDTVLYNRADAEKKAAKEKIAQATNAIYAQIRDAQAKVSHQLKVLVAMNPEMVLKRGYAILNGDISPGNVVKITTINKEIKAEVKEVNDRK
ncbi:exodeoxyribonuclease VII large subunit [Candidatus Saccharibacteria bacterium]|nr:exodeoxyribonuclease VII large subunit [Candidatus Saccharibacteria bacterium]